MAPSFMTSLVATCSHSVPISLLYRRDTRTFPTSTRSSRRRSRSWRRRGRPGTWRTPISCSSKTSRTWQTGAELNMTLFSFERTQFTTENNKQQCHLWFLKKNFYKLPQVFLIGLALDWSDSTGLPPLPLPSTSLKSLLNEYWKFYFTQLAYASKKLLLEIIQYRVATVLTTLNTYKNLYVTII